MFFVALNRALLFGLPCTLCDRRTLAYVRHVACSAETRHADPRTGSHRSDTFFEEDVSVLSRFAGHDDGEALLGAVVEVETVDSGDGWSAGDVAGEGGVVRGFHGGVEGVAVDGGHHDERVGDVSVELEEGKDGVEEGVEP